MSAQCAACLGPIAATDKFVLSGTEAFHHQCAAAGGVSRSRGVLRERELREALNALNAARCDLELARMAEARHKRKAEDLERDVARLRDRLQESTQLTEDYRRQRDASRRERDEAIAARDAARREAALHQQLARGSPAAADPGTKVTDLGEDQAKRFELLELD